MLFNHDMDEIRGVVEKAWLQDGRGWCRVRFAKTEDSEEALGMVQLRDDAKRVLEKNFPNSEFLAKGFKANTDPWWKVW